MAFAVVRSLLNAAKVSASNKVLLINPVSKSLGQFGVKNTRTLSRSLFYLCRSRDSDNLISLTTKTFSNSCSCGCALHTKGDKELAAFLAEEIENETKARLHPNLPGVEGFEYDLNGAEVTFRKKMDNETITVKANVNNSVDAEEAVMDPNETKDSPEPEMKSKPEFTVEILKGKKKLMFMCTFVQDVPEEVSNEQYNDVFQISEISMYEGNLEDETYCVSGDIMDGYLYDLLMNYLEERGISNQFADSLMLFFTSYEHKLYVDLLKGMKSFVEK